MSLPDVEVMMVEKTRHDWLAERTRWASVSVDFGRGGVYARHRVIWHVPGEWLSAEGQSFEEAVDNAMRMDSQKLDDLA
jgi:hypothetical protein